MKKTIFIILVILVAIRTDGFSQKKRDSYKVKADTVTVDSLEYELIVLDPGFEAWLATKPSKEFYSKEYYEQKNHLYVTEWNNRYLSSQNNGLYETYIDYNYNTDYGLDINYKLYYYFKFFEETNHIKLLNTSRWSGCRVLVAGTGLGLTIPRTKYPAPSPLRNNLHPENQEHVRNFFL
jgi:Family of unknown function (DUF6146)